jgi:hypothetical protein
MCILDATACGLPKNSAGRQAGETKKEAEADGVPGRAIISDPSVRFSPFAAYPT